MITRHIRLVPLAVLALAAVACGSDDDGGAASPGSTAAAPGTTSPAGSASAEATPPSSAPGADTDRCSAERRGGSVSMAMYSETPTLSPFRSTAKGVSGGTEMLSIFDTLMAYEQETNSFVPRVAESLTPNADFTEWTLVLPDDVEYGNGELMTAGDVQWNIEHHQDPDVGSSAATYTAYIDSMAVKDEHTLVFTLVGAWADFPYILSDKAGMIVNPRVYEEIGDDDAFGADPGGAGVGAFELASFRPGEEIRLTGKDAYWNGPVCLDELRFVALAGAQPTYDAFRAGDVDVAFLREPTVIAAAREDGADGASQLQNIGELLFMNTAEGTPTADVRVRRAVAAAIDLEALNERVNSGTGLVTSSIIGERSVFAGEVGGPEFDREAARSLVDEVKAEGEWDGSIELICDNAPARVTRALALEGMLEAAGFDVAVHDPVTTPALIETVFIERRFQLACWGWSAGDDDPFLQLDQNLRSDSPFNASGYTSEEMDALLVELREADTVEARSAVLDRMQEVWNETVPSAVMEASEELVVWQPDVHGARLSSSTKVIFGDAYRDG